MSFWLKGTKLTSLNPRNRAPDSSCFLPVSYTSKTFFKRMPYKLCLYAPGSVQRRVFFERKEKKKICGNCCPNVFLPSTYHAKRNILLWRDICDVICMKSQLELKIESKQVISFLLNTQHTYTCFLNCLHSWTLKNEPTPCPVTLGLSSRESHTDDLANTSTYEIRKSNQILSDRFNICCFTVHTSPVETLSGKNKVDNLIIARSTFVYIFFWSNVGSPKWIVRDTIVVPSVYWPPESRITGSSSVITMFVSLNVSKCGIDECGPNATVVLNERPLFDLIEYRARSISYAALISVMVSWFKY